MCTVCESGGDRAVEMREGKMGAGEGEEMEEKRQRGKGEKDENLLMSF